MVLQIKRNEEGIPETLKARTVAGGKLRTVGIDCDSVFAPVVNCSAKIFCLAISLQLGWTKKQVDVKFSFLYSEIDRETFVYHPYNVPRRMRSKNVYQSLRAFYGIRQALLSWLTKLRSISLKMGFKQHKSDGSILF